MFLLFLPAAPSQQHHTHNFWEIRCCGLRCHHPSTSQAPTSKPPTGEGPPHIHRHTQECQSLSAALPTAPPQPPDEAVPCAPHATGRGGGECWHGRAHPRAEVLREISHLLWCVLARPLPSAARLLEMTAEGRKESTWNAQEESWLKADLPLCNSKGTGSTAKQ